MKESKVKFKIFSDTDDIQSIKEAISHLRLWEIDAGISVPAGYVINDNEIIIAKLTSTNSHLFDKILEIKKTTSNSIIFVSDESNPLLISIAAKLQFTGIYILPSEFFKFVNFLKDLIKSGNYKTRKPSFISGYNDPFSSKVIYGKSPEFLKIVSLARKAAHNHNTNILILGETGAGKEVFARSIHLASEHKNGQFVDINCSAIPDPLLESELFGIEPGAFTGARYRRKGLFETAENGTIFLDEIGDLSPALQAKLLRAIEKKVIRRVGGLKDIAINARVISATNKDLFKMAEEKIFRKDLLYRLNAVTFTIPPLRERGEDILIIAAHYIQMYNKLLKKKTIRFDYEAKQFLLKYPWPGNVRELKNTIHRAVLLSTDKILRIKDLLHLTNNIKNKKKSSHEENVLPHLIRLDLNYTSTNLKLLEKTYAGKVLTKLNGNKSKTARLLCISRPKLDTLLK